VRLSQSDFDSIHHLSTESGLSISEMIRLRLISDDSEKIIAEISEAIKAHSA
jgi:hypothetical protein